MKNKFLQLSLVVGVLAVALVVIAAVGAFAFTISTMPAQAQEARIDASIDEAPVQIEQVVNHQVEKPVLTIERASYSGHSGGCQYERESAQQQMVEAPSKQIEDQLLTLAE